jgi:site-specific DNA-methyltransferase (adenine-specific)
LNIYNLDFEILLKEFSDNNFNLICIDPPYQINYKNKDFKDEFNFELSAKENYRLLKNNGNCLIFAGWSNVINIIEIYKKIGFILKNWIIYDRIKGRGSLYNFTSTREDLLWFVKSENYTFNKIFSNIPKKTKGMGLKNGQLNRSLSNVWTDISPVAPMSKEKVNYSCQKPIKLYERIIKIFSNENDLCLDYCCGSGGFGVGCKTLNRNFILNDSNIDAIKIVNQRI